MNLQEKISSKTLWISSAKPQSLSSIHVLQFMEVATILKSLAKMVWEWHATYSTLFPLMHMWWSFQSASHKLGTSSMTPMRFSKFCLEGEES